MLEGKSFYPVLKHGPRSLAFAQVELLKGVRRNESKFGTNLLGLQFIVDSELERKYWDPKDGELSLSKMKSGETLMKV